MKRRPTMQTIVLKDAEEVRAVKEAVERSLKDGIASRMVKEAGRRPPVLKGAVKR